MRFIHCGQGLVITKQEWDSFPDSKKGRIGSEWTPERSNKSYMWNRTLKMQGKMFVEGFNLCIE